MAEQKKRPTDESVDMDYAHLPINQEADRVPGGDDELDPRHSRRLSADLPYGLPTDDTHATGTPQADISSGFSDLRRGQVPHLEDDNAQRPRGAQEAVNASSQGDRNRSAGNKGGDVNPARNLARSETINSGTENLGGARMADKDRNQNVQQDDYDRPRGEKSRYDAEKEIPDPQQVERDIAEAEREYGDNKGKGNKVA
jgi:hypothetical protein